MSRYIDADELREQIDNYPFTEYCDYSNVIDMIDYAPTADVAPVKHWISVKERLPEHDGKYMVWYKGEWDICEFDAESQIFGYNYDAYDEHGEIYSTFICWDDIINKSITHWMPLPEPPKE